MKDLIVKGSIYHSGVMKNGTFSVLRNRFVDPSTAPDVEGTIIDAPINFHTHLGDSFIDAEPIGGIRETVGPGGIKARSLDGAPPGKVRGSIKKSISFMTDVGTQAFFDFRESGVKGLDLVPRFKNISGFFLSRPSGMNDAIPLLDRSSGFGMSALADYDYRYLKELSDLAHGRKKLFAVHFSENEREDVRRLISLRPDFIVHAIEASERDLAAVRNKGTPIAITPRSNIFHGKRPDYSKLFSTGITVLLGTDNAFITEPSIMGEVEFLYRYQRGLNRVSPEQILSTVTDNPRKVISKVGLELNDDRYLFYPNENLTPYQLVTRPNYYEMVVVSRKGDGITFFSRKH